MTPFTKLVRRSDSARITVFDVLRRDVLRWLLVGAMLMLIVYAVGWIVSGADDSSYPLHYYSQLTFINTPVAALVILGLAVWAATGSRVDGWFWVTLFAVFLVWLVSLGSLGSQIDPTWFVNATCAMIASLSARRIWEYYDLRYALKLRSPWLTASAVLLYVALVVLSIALLAPIG